MLQSLHRPLQEQPSGFGQIRQITTQTQRLAYKQRLGSGICSTSFNPLLRNQRNGSGLAWNKRSKPSIAAISARLCGMRRRS